jgi:hypothetical protein
MHDKDQKRERDHDREDRDEHCIGFPRIFDIAAGSTR